MPARTLIAIWALLGVMAGAHAGPLDKPVCIVPAKPGGGFDLTCQLARAALAESGALREPLQLSYVPGGIGAVAFSEVATQGAGRANAIVAFSAGSLLNLAQRKFGPYSENDVRWLAAIGLDHGAVVVADTSPMRTLSDLVNALKSSPSRVVFGAGGTIGSQDWFKAALLARAAGVNPRAMRFVAFEGGGEALTALQGGHIQVLTGDAAEALERMRLGAKVRLLAVLSPRRLPGELGQVPTAREQGIDIEWPIVRGFYMGGSVSDADLRAWADTLDRMMASPAFEAQRARRGLAPLSLGREAVDAHVRQQMTHYRSLVREFGLRGGS